MFYDIVVFAVALISTGTAGHALLNKRDPRSSLGWIVISLTLPGLGAGLYWLFGINRIRTRAERYREKGPGGLKPVIIGDGAKSSTSPRKDLPEYLHALDRIGCAVTGEELSGGHTVRVLYNGDDAYPAMLEAIETAEDRVLLSSYIFDHDSTGEAFVDALAAAKRRGVTVRVLLDGFDQFVSLPASRRLMGRADLEYAEFLPFSLRRPRIHINLRNHRKLLLVDGRVGFTGGMNISDRYLVSAAKWRHPVRDLHFRVVGPAVLEMEEVFLHDWAFASGETDLHFDPPDCDASPESELMCRCITHGPDERIGRLLWVLVGACHAAHTRIAILTPYFLPGKILISALCAAALRGVQVEIVLPSVTDHPVVAWATRSRLWELLELGVKVYFQPPPFDHSKLLLVDDLYALIGSANIDARSLHLNFEFNLEMYNDQLGSELAAHFDRLRDSAHRVTLEEMDGRSLPIRLRDASAKLFSPYL